MISIPDSQWDVLLDAFAQAPRGHERIAYLDGIRWTESKGRQHGVVTTVTVPDAVLTRGNYSVTADAMRNAGEHLFALGLVRLAQVHTHGTYWTDHSSTDDRRAYSRRDGAISIVLPHHARHRPNPEEGGVHLLDSGVWRRLGDDEVENVLRIIPTRIDLRPTRAMTPWWKKVIPWNR